MLHKTTAPSIRITSEASSKVSTGNSLLDGLPMSDLEQLRAHLEIVKMAPRRFFFAAKQPVPYVYFPRGGLVSLMVTVAGGRSVQAAAIGCDGMVGVSVVLEANDPPFDCVCVVGGDALRIPIDQFTRCTRESAVLQIRMLRYAHGLFNETVRTAACNGLHSVEQRLARCLLLTRDRLKTATFPVTDAVLGQMLGVTRSFVTRSVNKLEAARLVSHRRGIMHLLDDAGLESLACEDYQATRADYTRLLG